MTQKTIFIEQNLPGPEWYDGRSELVVSGDMILVAHPMFAAQVWSFEKKRFLEIRVS